MLGGSSRGILPVDLSEAVVVVGLVGQQRLRVEDLDFAPIAFEDAIILFFSPFLIHLVDLVIYYLLLRAAGALRLVVNFDMLKQVRSFQEEFFAKWAFLTLSCVLGYV
jgi:hypothetical protein